MLNHLLNSLKLTLEDKTAFLKLFLSRYILMKDRGVNKRIGLSELFYSLTLRNIIQIQHPKEYYTYLFRILIQNNCLTFCIVQASILTKENKIKF